VIRIVVLCVVAAVVYGVLHDQVTARVSVEYFTVFHPKVVDSESPTVLGLVWGVLATWWVGLILGVLLAATARWGPRPRASARDLARPLVVALGVVGVLATVAGVVGWQMGRAGTFVVAEPFASQIPRERHARFLAALWAHNASYLGATVAGLWLAFRTWRRRGRALEAPARDEGSAPAG
jgi:hypothetical protein